MDLDADPVKVSIRGEYTKTGNPRVTYISREAAEAIHEWLKVQFEEVPEKGAYRGKYRTLSDLEHAELCRLYSEGVGMQIIAERMGRSTKTVFDHIRKHEEAVARLGYCPKCRRARSGLEKAMLKGNQ